MAEVKQGVSLFIRNNEGKMVLIAINPFFDNMLNLQVREFSSEGILLDFFLNEPDELERFGKSLVRLARIVKNKGTDN